MIVTLLTFTLLLAGVIGSVMPRVPGATFSLGGVLLYWWASGFAEPGTLTLALLVFAGVLALVGRVVAPVISARLGGASILNASVAGLVGIALFFLLGFSVVGLLAGTIVAVFVLEARRQQSLAGGVSAAIATMFGSFGSTALQMLLTGVMLVVMVVVVLV